MKAAKFIALVGMILMFAAILYAFIVGDFGREGSVLLTMPWGIVSMVDLYTGFILFSLWIVYREKQWPIAMVWVVLMLVLGFFTGALYTYIALQKSGGDWNRFWHGTRVAKSPVN